MELLGVGPERGRSYTSFAAYDISAPTTDLSELAHTLLSSNDQDLNFDLYQTLRDTQSYL